MVILCDGSFPKNLLKWMVGWRPRVMYTWDVACSIAKAVDL